MKKLDANLDKMIHKKQFGKAQEAVSLWFKDVENDDNKHELEEVMHSLQCYIEWKKYLSELGYSLNKVSQKIYDDALSLCYNKLPDYAKWRG